MIFASRNNNPKRRRIKKVLCISFSFLGGSKALVHLCKTNGLVYSRNIRCTYQCWGRKSVWNAQNIFHFTWFACVNTFLVYTQGITPKDSPH